MRALILLCFVDVGAVKKTQNAMYYTFCIGFIELFNTYKIGKGDFFLCRKGKYQSQ